MLEESLLMFNLYVNMGLVTLVFYMMIKIHSLQRVLDSIPDPMEQLEQLLKTKIPVLMGPDGQPVLGPLELPHKEKNPLVG